MKPPSEQDLLRAAEIVRGQERSAATLALMGDKSFLLSSSGKSLLMYAKRGRSWVALFDPVGLSEEWPELVYSASSNWPTGTADMRPSIRFIPTACRSISTPVSEW